MGAKENKSCCFLTMKSYSKGKSVVEIEESYHYLEEKRLFIDFFFSDR